MATIRWRGDAPAVKQVNTSTVGGTPANGQLYSVLSNGKTVTYTATGGDTNNTIASNLQTSLAASTIPEFQEVTWTVATNVITGTSTVAGRPFTNTSSATGTGTLVTATTTASSGPNDWSTAANWSTGAVPVNGDTVFIETPVNILYGLAQSAVTVTTLNIQAAFTGQVGLPQQNAGGYFEYRPTYLQIGATTINVGDGPGNGSGFIRLNTGSVQTTLIIRGTAGNVEAGRDAVGWLGTNASNAVVVLQGELGIAMLGGESATVQNLYVGYESSKLIDALVNVGNTATVTTVLKSGGTLTLWGNGATTLSQASGDTFIQGGNVTTLTVSGGKVHYQGTGTITTAYVGGKGSLHFASDLRGRTVTNTNLAAGGKIVDPLYTVTWSNPIQPSAGPGPAFPDV